MSALAEVPSPTPCLEWTLDAHPALKDGLSLTLAIPGAIFDPAPCGPQPVTITDDDLYGGHGGWLTDEIILAAHAAWDDQAWLRVTEGSRLGGARPVPPGAPPDGRVRVHGPMSGELPVPRDEAPTLMPEDGVPVLTAETERQLEAAAEASRAQLERWGAETSEMTAVLPAAEEEQ